MAQDAATQAPADRQEAVDKAAAAQARQKLLSPRPLQEQSVKIEHPDGDVDLIAIELPWLNYRQWRAAVAKQPDREDELLAINALVTPAYQTVLTLDDVKAFDDMPATHALTLIQPCREVNGRG